MPHMLADRRVTELWFRRRGPPVDTERVNVGVLGCGHVADQYLRNCARFDSLRLVACADVDLERAQRKAAEHAVPHACLPQELIDDPEVDLVVNLTPPQAHAEVSVAAIRGGKHVWSEKPLAASLDAAREVLAAAKGAGVRVGCAPDTFLGGGLQTSIKLVDDGWIGEPVAAAALVSEHGYEHFHPDVESFYRRGGGPALDLGPYYITALVAMLGPVARLTAFARATFPERIVPCGPRAGQPIPVEVPTHVTGSLEFRSGALASVLTSWDIWATHLPFLELYGTDGSLSAGNPDLFDAAPLVRRGGHHEVPWTEMPLIHSGDVGRGIGIADMAEAIGADRSPRASGELAFHVLEVLCGLERSAREGRHVDVHSRCERPAPLDHPIG
jgi:predicted dehydrogenase